MFLPTRALVASTRTLCIALLCACGVALTGRASEEHREYDVKAVFLLNFARFIEWPDQDADRPFVIAVLGADPFGHELDFALKGEKVGSRPIVARRAASLDEAAEADAVFISRSEKRHLAEILAQLEKHPTLTVSDIPQFAAEGGMVEMVTEGSKIRLNINVTEAREAHLTISSKLLRAARIVTTHKTSFQPNWWRSEILLSAILR